MLDGNCATGSGRNKHSGGMGCSKDLEAVAVVDFSALVFTPV